MEKTKFESATTWLQGVIAGYQKQVNDFSSAPNPDQGKIKACKERQDLCQYILDFMVKANQEAKNASKKSESNNGSSQNPSTTSQNGSQSISARSMANCMDKQYIEQIELVLGLESAISFCRASLVLDLPLGSKESLLKTIKDLILKQKKEEV